MSIGTFDRAFGKSIFWQISFNSPKYGF